jgi:hypothetical protein
MDQVSTQVKNWKFYLARSIGALLLTAMAAVFFFSAYSKIYTDNAFDNFQWTFIDIGISSINVAGILARGMIGLELMLGLLLLGHVYLRSFTYKAVIGILLFFIAYLLIVIFKQGNNGNCGCFGDKLAMTPLNAIWKNLAMIAVTVLLWFIYPIKPYKHQSYVLIVLAVLAFTLPYIKDPIDIGTAPVRYHQPLDLSVLYQNTTDSIPSVELRQGRHIVAFMSLTCIHCKKTAYLMQIIHREHPDIPFFMVLAGHENFRKDFFSQTHADSIPHLFYNHANEFAHLAGSGVPSIYWVNDGKVEFKSVNAYYQLDPAFIENWLNGKFKP